MAKGYKASAEALKRFAGAAERVERTPLGSTPVKRQAHTPQTNGFFAKITQHENDAEIKYRYSWQRIRITDEDELDEMGSWGGGAYSADEGYAVEVNQSEHVVVGDIVWMQIQHDPFCYVFQYSPGVRIGRTHEVIEACEGTDVKHGLIELWRRTVTDGGVDAIELAGNYDDTEYWVITAFHQFDVEIPTGKKVFLTYSTTDRCWWITEAECEE
jgi:hypothetical protein